MPNSLAQSDGTVHRGSGTAHAVSIYNPNGVDYAAIRQSYMDAVTNSEEWATMTDFDRLLLFLLMDNGLRISEVTDTRRAKVMDETLVLIWQHKTQSWRAVRHRAASMGFSLEELQFKLRTNCRQRFSIYRTLRRCGVVYHAKGRQRDAVTHLFRRLLALTVWQQTQSLASVQAAIGHKSVTSTMAYLDEALRMAPPKPRRVRRSHDSEVRNYIATTKNTEQWHTEQQC